MLARYRSVVNRGRSVAISVGVVRCWMRARDQKGNDRTPRQGEVKEKRLPAMNGDEQQINQFFIAANRRAQWWLSFLGRLLRPWRLVVRPSPSRAA